MIVTCLSFPYLFPPLPPPLQPPSRASQNGELLGYKVWYGKLSYNNSEVTEAEYGDIGWTMHEMELITLIRGQLYEVKVNAFNARGHGPYSTPVDVYVGEAGQFWGQGAILCAHPRS